MTNRKKERPREIFQHTHSLDLISFSDLHKIGGFHLFPVLLEDSSAEMRASTCSLIATAVQNNPYCQTEAVKLGLLAQLLAVLDKDSNTQVKIKALYAVSCKYSARKCLMS